MVATEILSLTTKPWTRAVTSYVYKSFSSLVALNILDFKKGVRLK